MFYVLDILDCDARCSISYLLRKNPKYFFDVGGDNQQSRLHMGDCNGNFEIGKIIDDATKIEVKVESYTLSATKDFVHAMATMQAAHYVFNVEYASKTFGAMYFMQKYLLGIDDETKCPSKVLTLFSKLVKTNTIQ